MADEPRAADESKDSAAPPTRSKRPSGLKVVTLSPLASVADTESSPAIKIKKDPYLGATVDERYKLEEILGEGGMGVVYRCRHTIIDKRVAMKVLRADMARDEEVTERFLTEARAASAIGNPHIIDISDFGLFADGSTYFVMEYLDGVPLSEVVTGHEPVPVPRILHISRQLAEGLSAAHHAGIIHRDLKPDNIFLVSRGKEKDFVKILDFGIAKVSTQGHKLTRAGSVFGTPHYMSPEQAAGAPVDHRGDIYSLGVIMYELASGRVPFDADNFMGILTQHMYKAPVPIRALVPEPQEIPPGLEAVILKCLSKRPEQRYQSMDELLEDLTTLIDGLVPTAVQEMMSRTGGFNVPADYFKKAAMPAPMPAAPSGAVALRSRWPMYVGVAGVLFAVGLVGTILVMGANGNASVTPVAAELSIPKRPTDPGPAAETATKPIAIAVEPSSAVVKRNGEDLGDLPVILQVGAGEVIELTIEADGYESRTIGIDDSVDKRMVKLTKLDAEATPVRPRPGTQPARARVAPRATPKPAQPDSTSALGGGDIVNPWAK